LILLTATLCLLAGGAVMIYSAASALPSTEGGADATAYLVKYLVYGTLGFVALQIASRMKLEAVRRLTPPLLGLAFFLLLLVKIPGIGVELYGARRWIGTGPLQFQPSELMKLALMLYAVHLLASKPQMVGSLKAIASPLLVVAGAAVVLIASQPDLGTALVCVSALAALLVAAGIPMRLFGAMAGAAIGLVTIFAVIEPYRRERLTSFLDPWAHMGDAGYQPVQGQLALMSGGLFGNGVGTSRGTVPGGTNDFILAVIGEELGVAGITALLFLYALIAYGGFRVTRQAHGAYAQLLAAGLTSLILCQAVLNVFAVLGLAPLTGVPLPFISSGSSSLLVLLTAMGLLLNVASLSGRAPARAALGLARHREPAQSAAAEP
jgi:cell division protein FtsW